MRNVAYFLQCGLCVETALSIEVTVSPSLTCFDYVVLKLQVRLQTFLGDGDMLYQRLNRRIVSFIVLSQLY